jgi:ribulose 1,5-bisphosphate synthetase/thiazole synthase
MDTYGKMVISRLWALVDKKQFVRRTADWLEKISVAGFAVGIFQGGEKMAAGVFGGLLAIICSHILDNLWRKS